MKKKRFLDTTNHRLNRRQFFKAALGGGLMGGLVGAGGYRYMTTVEPSWLAVEQIQVPIAQLPPALDGLRIAQLSDLHVSQHTPLHQIAEAIALCNSLTPDLVAITGDMVWHDLALMPGLAKALAQLQAPLGVFTILGNHDLWIDAPMITRYLAREGLEPLVNRGQVIEVADAGLYVAGLDDAWCGAPDLEAAMKGCPTDMPALLLLHEPDPADDMAEDARIVLQLSGHSHGGQVRLPILGAPILPYLAQRYPFGLHRVKDMWVYTNRGIGVSGIKVRFRCRPEITILTLSQA